MSGTRGTAWSSSTATWTYIPAGADWEVRDWPEEDMLYAWGPDLPDDFLTNFEAVEG